MTKKLEKQNLMEQYQEIIQKQLEEELVDLAEMDVHGKVAP